MRSFVSFRFGSLVPLLAVVCGVFMEAEPASAQCPTSSATPAFQRGWGGEIRDLFTLAAGTTQYVWTAEEGGRIARSTDGGTTFTYASTPDNARSALLDIFFVDALHGWACGKDGVVLKSTDGGLTWSWADPTQQPVRRGECPPIPFPPPTPPPAVLWSVYFESATHGWLAGEGVLRESTDGGQTWTPVNLITAPPAPPPSEYENEGCWEFYAIDFVQRGGGPIGLVSVEKRDSHAGVVFRTLDGVNWTLIDAFTVNPPLSAVPDDFEAWEVEFVDAPTSGEPNAYLVGADTSRGRIFVSRDDGLSWTQEERNQASPNPDCSLAPCADCGTTPSCAVEQPNDCGSTTMNFHGTSKVMSPLYALAVLGGGSAIAVGYGGERYVRDASLDKWTEYTNRCEFTGPLNGVCALDPLTVITGGTWGFLAKSTNGGACFRDLKDASILTPALDQSTNFRVYDVSFVDDLTGWMCGSEGVVFKTTDGGCHFFEQLNDRCNSNSVLSALVVNSSAGLNYGVSVGGSGNIYRLDNTSGEQWVHVGSVPTSNNLTCASRAGVANPQTFWVGGEGGVVLKSQASAGATWSLVSWDVAHTLPASVNIRGLSMIGADNGFLVGEDSGAGVIYRISHGNSATPWADLVVSGVPPVNAVSAVSIVSGGVWAAGEQSTLYGWTGSTFTTIAITPPAGVSLAGRSFECVEVVRATGEVYLGSDHGLLLHSTTPLVANSWTAPNSHTSKTLRAFEFRSASLGFAVAQTVGALDASADQGDGGLMVLK